MATYLLNDPCLCVPADCARKANSCISDWSQYI